jgi:hypothetical protein
MRVEMISTVNLLSSIRVRVHMLAAIELITLGGRLLLKKICAAMCAAMLLAACARHPMTDQELQGKAQHAVDDKLETQAAFTLMESVAAQHIACGHAFAADAPNRGKVDQDFVYLHGRLIMDDDPDFDQAAMECDVAASGGNSMAVQNTADD